MVTVNEVFRDFSIDGVASSGAHKVEKKDVRKLLSAMVTGSSDGIYDFIPASNTGAGTANAIQATTDVALPATPNGALIALQIVAPNTASPVTVSFNGGAPLTIKTAAGNDPVVGGLVPGVVAGYQSGSTFRLLSDVASAAIVAAAEAEANRAEAARDAAIGAVPNVFSLTRTALKALNTTAITSAYLTEPGVSDVS